MTRIAVIAGTYLPESCGMADYVSHISATLSEYGVESDVLTTYYAAEAAYDPKAIGVVHGWRWADMLPLVQAVHATNADILHIQYASANYGFERTILLLPLLLRATGWRSPIVTTVHDYKLWRQQHGWWDKGKSFLLTLSNAVITTNADTQQMIQKQLPKLTSRVFFIPVAATIEVAPMDAATSAFSQSFNWQSIAKSHLDIYKNLIAETC